MAADVPSVFQVQYAVPSLPVVPGSAHCSPATEPCCAPSGYVSTPADHVAPNYPTYHITIECHPLTNTRSANVSINPSTPTVVIWVQL